MTRPVPPATFPLPVGLILAGGLGRRMAGAEAAPGPKPLVPLAGRPLIAHVIARLRPQVGRLLINANDPPAAFADFGLPVIADTLPDRPGPLAGVLAGLDHLARADDRADDADDADDRADDKEAGLLTVAADTPFLPCDLVERLVRRHLQTGAIVCAGSEGRRHHIIALWPPSVRESLMAALVSGERKVGLLLDRLGAVTESWDSRNGDPFFNVNTPEDLAVATFRSSALQ